jgi:hypothetical protein
MRRDTRMYPAIFSAMSPSALQTVVDDATFQTTRACLGTSAERRAAKLANRLRHRALASPILFRRRNSIESPPCTPTVLSPVPSNSSLHSQLRALLQRLDGSPSERALTNHQDEFRAEPTAASSPVSCHICTGLSVSELMQDTNTYSHTPGPATVTCRTAHLSRLSKATIQVCHIDQES